MLSSQVNTIPTKPDHNAAIAGLQAQFGEQLSNLTMREQHKMLVIAFGIGSSLEGQLKAPYGGLSIDMHALDAILQVNNEDLTSL